MNGPPLSDDDAEDVRLRMVWNEQRRVEAMFINNLGVAVMVTGVITPVLASLYGLSNAPDLSWLTNGWIVIISFVIGAALNAAAAQWLKGLV